MNHFYQNIQGWFTFPNLYTLAVKNATEKAHFVEVGVWKGTSAAYMAVEIANSGKDIHFDCVDTWEGSEEHYDNKSHAYEPQLQQKDWLYHTFLKNLEPAKDYINPVRCDSLTASKRYKDNSLDFVFIDASHDYNNVLKDIEAWFPKVKQNGTLAGHDYYHADVKKAVHDYFDNMGYAIHSQEGCWVTEKAL